MLYIMKAETVSALSMQPFLHPGGYIECRTLDFMTVEYRNGMLMHTTMGEKSAPSGSIHIIMRFKYDSRNCGHTF